MMNWPHAHRLHSRTLATPGVLLRSTRRHTVQASLPPNRDRRLRSTGAFTLIELLIVVGVIGILVTLTMVTVRLVRDQAESTRCFAGLNRYGAAVLMYSSENRGYYPIGYVLDGSNNGYHMTWNYWTAWADYFANDGTGGTHIAKILACPTANRSMKVSGVASAKSLYVTQWPIGPYAARNTRTTDILFPAQTGLMVDAGQFNYQGSGGFYPPDGMNSPPLMPHRGRGTWTQTSSSPGFANLNQGIGYFTRGKGVVLYFDGRAAILDLDPTGKSATAIPWPRPTALGQRTNWNLFWNNNDSKN